MANLTSEFLSEDPALKTWPKAARFGLEVIWPLLAAMTLVCFLCNESRAAPFEVAFKPLKVDVALAEGAWQAENAIDLAQTLRIAREPARYREVGTLGVFCGPHPSATQVWVGSIAFGIGHYAVTQLLENAGWDTAARIWSYGSLGAKSWNIDRNRRVGLGY